MNPMILAGILFVVSYVLLLALPKGRAYVALAGGLSACLNKPDFIAYKIGPRPARVLRMREKGVLLIGWTSLDYETDAKENDGVIFESCTPPLKYDQL